MSRYKPYSVWASTTRDYAAGVGYIGRVWFVEGGAKVHLDVARELDRSVARSKALELAKIMRAERANLRPRNQPDPPGWQDVTEVIIPYGLWSATNSSETSDPLSEWRAYVESRWTNLSSSTASTPVTVRTEVNWAAPVEVEWTAAGEELNRAWQAWRSRVRVRAETGSSNAIPNGENFAALEDLLANSTAVSDVYTEDVLCQLYA